MSLGLIPTYHAGAQIGGASERGTDLGLLVDSLTSGAAVAATAGLPCDHIWDNGANLDGFNCLLGAIGHSFQVNEQWELTQQIFEVRFGERRTWQALEAALAHQSSNLGPTQGHPQSLFVPIPLIDRRIDERQAVSTFEGLIDADNCPAVVSFDPLLPDDVRVQWLATPEGLRDLSPPRVQVETPARTLLREGLVHRDPASVLGQTPCLDLRLPLTRALARSALAFGELEKAAQLAELAYMPRRYARQALGARQDEAAMSLQILDAADAVLEGQFSLTDPSQIEAEVAVLLNEIDRQFSIDFLLGRLWSLSIAELNALEFDDDFVSEIAQLLSQDARLLQQAYGPLEVRFFYTDFFEILVAKQAFDLLHGLDLLVPSVIRSDFQLALSAKPLTAASPTRFEQDQEALALLIRLQEVDVVLGVWSELSAAQRQDAVLYAFDQGAWQTVGTLYSALSPDQLSADFLIRLSLYYADALDDVEEDGGNLQIDLELGGSL